MALCSSTGTKAAVRGWALGVLSASFANAQTPPAGSLHPIRDSATRIVEQFGETDWPGEQERAGCGSSSEGVPCFPVSTIKRRPQWATALRQSLAHLGPEESPSPSRPPTLAELQPYRPGPIGPLMVLGAFDPICVGKSVLKRLKGKNDAYYLYHVRDPQGERVALYDHRVTAQSFQGELEFLGRWNGECKAVAAYRHEDRKAAETEVSVRTEMGVPRPRSTAGRGDHAREDVGLQEHE